MSAIDYSLNDRIAGIAEQFAEFRARAKPRERVPEDLRVAILALTDAGVSLSTAARACGIQLGQLIRWRDRRVMAAPPPPRILKVVDTPAPPTSDECARVTIDGRRIVIELPLGRGA